MNQKKKLGEDFKRKIEKEMGNMLIKLFVQFPTIFYNFSEEEEKANEFINYLVELLFNLIYCYLSQHNDIEKYQIINQKFYKIKSDIIDPKKIKKYSMVCQSNNYSYFNSRLLYCWICYFESFYK